MSGRSIADNVKKDLFGNSANYCNLCSADGSFYRHIRLEMAHIIAFADDPSAPRYVKGRSGDNSYGNLILLCPNHHTEIDHKDNLHKYTIEFLLKVKSDHEQLILEKFSERVENLDSILLQRIHSAVNFQKILNGLEWNPSFISEEIFSLSIFLDVINDNRPSYYPFKATVFNNLTNLISENWSSLKCYLRDQGIYNHLILNQEFKLKLVSNRDYYTIILNCIYLKAALKLWIEVIRRDYPKINLH